MVSIINEKEVRDVDKKEENPFIESQKILRKQLELLSERSKDADDKTLVELSEAMVKVFSAIVLPIYQ